MLGAVTKFDRLKFIYETNIDLIHIIQTQFRETYKKAFDQYKGVICPEFEELLQSDINIQKRLYPTN